jgi:hypothetical protein
MGAETMRVPHQAFDGVNARTMLRKASLEVVLAQSGDWLTPTARYRPAFSPAERSCVPSASARRLRAEPGASGCCWLSCGAQPER